MWKKKYTASGSAIIGLGFVFRSCRASKPAPSQPGTIFTSVCLPHCYRPYAIAVA